MRATYGFTGTSDAVVLSIGTLTCDDRANAMSQAATASAISSLMTGPKAADDPIARLAEKDLCAKYIPAVVSHVVAAFTGSSDTSTSQFTISGNDSGNWIMTYSYDCSQQLGGDGNFIVNEDGGNDSTSSAVQINNLDKGQTGAWNVYGDAGTHYLSIQTQCPYTIKIVQKY